MNSEYYEEKDLSVSTPPREELTQPKPESKEYYMRFCDDTGEDNSGFVPTESTLQYLNPLQRIAQGIASICGLYVIPKNHIHNWDQQEFEMQDLEGDDFNRGQTLGSCLTINAIVMAISEYNHYHRGRPNKNILR